MVLQLGAEEESLVAVVAIIRARAQAVLHHVLLESGRCCEHRRTHVAGETSTPLEGVFDKVTLEAKRRVEGGAAQVTFVHRPFVQQVGRHVGFYFGFRCKTFLAFDALICS